MVNTAGQLAALERIARIKAEHELKKFAVFSQHMTALRNRAAQSEHILEESYRSKAPLTVPESRMANAQAARAARDYQNAKQEIKEMLPRFEEIRQAAAREFGRAEVLRELTLQQRRKRQNDQFGWKSGMSG